MERYPKYLCALVWHTLRAISRVSHEQGHVPNWMLKAIWFGDTFCRK